MIDWEHNSIEISANLSFLRFENTSTVTGSQNIGILTEIEYFLGLSYTFLMQF